MYKRYNWDSRDIVKLFILRIEYTKETEAGERAFVRHDPRPLAVQCIEKEERR